MRAAFFPCAVGPSCSSTAAASSNTALCRVQHLPACDYGALMRLRACLAFATGVVQRRLLSSLFTLRPKKSKNATWTPSVGTEGRRVMQGGAGYVLGALSLAVSLASLRGMSSLPIVPLFLAQTPVPSCSRELKAMAPPYSCTGAHLGGAADTDAASTPRYLLPLAHLWIPMALHVGAPPPWPTLVPCRCGSHSTLRGAVEGP